METTLEKRDLNKSNNPLIEVLYYDEPAGIRVMKRANDYPTIEFRFRNKHVVSIAFGYDIDRGHHVQVNDEALEYWEEPYDAEALSELLYKTSQLPELQYKDIGAGI